MVKITEEVIPREKEPIFIDYSTIPGSSKKKLLFLKTLLQLINKRDNFIRYEELGLNKADTEIFKDYLKNFQAYFRLEKNKINLIENYNGKIICQIDLLINDVFTVLSEIDFQNTSSDLSIKNSTENKINEQVEKPEEKPFRKLGDISKDPVKKGSNKYLNEIFNNGICLAEAQLFVNKILKEVKPEHLEEIFNFSEIDEEINKIPHKIKNKETNYENAVLLRDIIVKILKKIESNVTNFKYWEELIINTETLFSKILEQCDQELLELISENGSSYKVTINEIFLNENIKIFLAELGNPGINNRNAVISRCNNKIAVFNFKFELSSKIQPNDFVLVEIDENAGTYVKINPLKILKREECLKLINLGIDTSPSKEAIFAVLSGGT